MLHNLHSTGVPSQLPNVVPVVQTTMASHLLPDAPADDVRRISDWVAREWMDYVSIPGAKEMPLMGPMGNASRCTLDVHIRVCVH